MATLPEADHWKVKCRSHRLVLAWYRLFQTRLPSKVAMAALALVPRALKDIAFDLQLIGVLGHDRVRAGHVQANPLTQLLTAHLKMMP